ncbi:cytochrome ubiquinol oxidase subunit I [Nocardiopsis ganjiahuensis]|nr:cytochrome ubiquinol oxidase subunit I [Nocardiopsis ganjiahuensis]
MDVVVLARLQLAVTTNLHFVFVALTLGLVPVVALVSLVLFTVVLGPCR